MNVTGIEWTATVMPDGTVEPGFTSNPVKYRDKATGEIVWACVKRSPGCANCYAEALALRYGRGGPFTRDAMSKVEPLLCEKELRALLTSPKLAGKKVFVGDMTDCFAEWVADALLDRLFAAFTMRPDVTFQILTKRADRMAAYLADPGTHLRVTRQIANFVDYTKPVGPWPMPSVWCGFSAENQEWFDRRAIQMASAMRAGWTVFVSAEPLLGDIKMAGWDGKIQRNWLTGPDGPGVSWVIAGGESGPDSRTCRVEWLTSLRDQCKAAGVPFFCKQLGSRPTTTLPPGESWPGHPGPSGPVQFSGDGFGNYLVLGLKNRKGGDMAEWPESLRVRDFPTTQREAQPCK